MTTSKPLTPKQAAFVREYLIDLCAADAARRAGFAGAHVRKTAHELMQKPEVQAAIGAAQAKRAARVEDSQDEVLRDLRRIGQMAEARGDFGPALRAAELRGKHLGMFRERVEHTGVDGGPIEQSLTVSFVKAK